jgi:hypothetical protein
MFQKKQPPKPVHITGTNKGEELVMQHGREPGRSDDEKYYRTARDSTGLNPSQHEPIDPRMPQIPPA